MSASTPETILLHWWPCQSISTEYMVGYIVVSTWISMRSFMLKSQIHHIIHTINWTIVSLCAMCCVMLYIGCVTQTYSLSFHDDYACTHVPAHTHTSTTPTYTHTYTHTHTHTTHTHTTHTHTHTHTHTQSLPVVWSAHLLNKDHVLSPSTLHHISLHLYL